MDTHATGRATGTNLMIYIVLIAVIGILLLQLTGSIPLSSVGGPMAIALAFFAAALAVGIHEAWTKKRGVLGWIVNIVVSFVGAFLAAQLGGLVMVMMLCPFMDGASSLAATGVPVMSVALAGHDGHHAVGIVGRAVGCEPVAMSSFSGERAAATTAHFVPSVFSISAWTTARLWHIASVAAMQNLMRYRGRVQPINATRLWHYVPSAILIGSLRSISRACRRGAPACPPR